MKRQTRYTRYIFLLLLLLSFFVAAASADRVVVTGGRVVYDAFGRVIKTYHPTVDRLDVSVYSDTVDAEPPTVTEYDVLDRPVKVTYPDSTFTETAYGVSGPVQVVTVTDAMGNVSKTHVDGSGRTAKSIRFESPGSQDSILTEFFYDGIGRLVSVRDADGNVTTSVYDMADRRLRVTHPASGEAVFTYDALGNMLTRRTASGDTISYCYELGRLKDVLYPKHPEYNVHYHYGGPRHPNNAGGRVRFREDATGGIEYSYDQMGNVSETLRTVVVPNDSVGAGTFRTSFKYDAFGKLLSMTYPDGEVVCYLYDRSGQLVSVYIYDYAANDRYVAAIGYDKFGDRVYMEYGNGTATRYAYDIMRRLDTVYVSMPGGSWLNRTYTYDVVGNITSQDNTGSDTGLLYTPVSHEYGYDGLYRLTSAKGNRDNTENGYTLAMTYDKMYRVKTKNQRLWQTGVQFEGTLRSGYNLSYSYSSAPGRRFQMSTVSDLNYRCEGAQTAADNVYEKHKYRYDANGNIEHVNTARRKADKDYWDLAHEECFRWDEENRLMAISQDGYVSNYWYDADGERVIKEHGNNQAVFVNSGQDSVSTDTRQFTIYPSAYLTVHNGNWYTNHIYIGSERIASHLGTMDPDEGLSFYSEEHSAGAGMDKMLYSVRCDTLVAVMASNYAHFGLPYNGKNRMVHTPRPDLAPSEPGGAEGGMRFYWMMGGIVEGADGNGGPRRSAKSDHGLNQAPKYFYHSDHLGSSSLVTNTSGIVIQQMDYLPYGEVFLEKRNEDVGADYFTPYKFNGKELDEETGLYYYGARYMNPRLSIWYATDPLEEKYPQLSSYCYTACNPIVLLDTDGKDIIIAGKNKSSVTFITKKINVSVDASSIGVDWGGCYTLQGRAVLGAALDIVGVFDPTGLADGFNAKLQFDDGEWGGALISAFGLIPYVGDVAKVGKINKDIKVIEAAIDAFKESKNAAKAVNGNSKTSSKAQHVYEIFDTETGKTVKTGISGGKVSKNGKSYRATSQVNKWNKTAGRQVYDSKIVEEIPAGKNARAKALDSEKKNANKLRQQGQLDPKFHKRP